MASERTKQCIKRRNIFLIISTIMWIGVAAVMIFGALIKFTKPTEVIAETVKEPMFTITDSTKNTVISLSITMVIGILGTIIIKDKIRTFMWMLSLIVGSIVYGKYCMYIVLALWFVEEYVFRTLYNYYKQKVSINKEIDLRG